MLIDAAQELRLLECGQRLMHRRRNVLAPEASVSSGHWLFDGALGAAADLVEPDPAQPSLHARDGDALQGSRVFAARGVAARRWWPRAGTSSASASASASHVHSTHCCAHDATTAGGGGKGERIEG